MLLRTSLLGLTLAAIAPVAHAAESYDNCKGYIDALPATVTSPGVWCLRRDLVANLASGTAITVGGGNITIDCNGFRVENTAGLANGATGVLASQKVNVTVRNCNVRGFYFAMQMFKTTEVGPADGHFVVENNVVQGATNVGIHLIGHGSVVRNNTLLRTGGTTVNEYSHFPIMTDGSVDILDNTVSGVTGFWAQYGIYTSNNIGGNVSGNRVRDVVSTGQSTRGIWNENSQRMILRGNDIALVGGGEGIVCDATSRARGNFIAGVQTALSGCVDAGGNDITP